MPLDQRVASPRRAPRARWVRTAILGIGGLVLVGLAGTPPLLGDGAYHGVVMGSKYFLSSFPGGGLGWGTPRPKTLFNGGDPSGYISKITWTSWGGSIATGSGMNPIFRPQGGYYPNPVKIQLRASSIGICYPGGPRTYRRLIAREPSRPGGPMGHWFVWSGQRSLCKWH